jgi:galactose mutarotase-like enzyme
MRKILISNNNGLTGAVFPDYGGMLAGLEFRGKKILAYDEEQMILSPLLFGGNPVLFPFPSKTKNDSYLIEGKEYHMPFHGLVVNAAFSVEECSENSVRLSITNSETNLKEHYPFQYRLGLKYTLLEDGVNLSATVENRADRKLPHYFGWHFYFAASDKTKLELKIPMKRYIDYADGQTKTNNSAQDLCVKTDYVFFDKTGAMIEMINHADGYRAELILDEVFEVATVCTRFDGKICVEPWIGLPDSINSGKYVQWVDPGIKETYGTTIKLYDLDEGFKS